MNVSCVAICFDDKHHDTFMKSLHSSCHCVHLPIHQVIALHSRFNVVYKLNVTFLRSKIYKLIKLCEFLCFRPQVKKKMKMAKNDIKNSIYLSKLNQVC